PLAAFAGALVAIGVVYLAARAGGRSTPYALLLVGVVFNVLASAVIMLLNVVASYAQAHGVLFWLMGSLSGQSWGLIAAAAAYALGGLAWLGVYAQDLNLLAAGEEGAAELGVDVARARERPRGRASRSGSGRLRLRLPRGARRRELRGRPGRARGGHRAERRRQDDARAPPRRRARAERWHGAPRRPPDEVVSPPRR